MFKCRVSLTNCMKPKGLNVKSVSDSAGINTSKKIHKNKIQLLSFRVSHIYVQNMGKIAHFRNLRDENSSGIPVSGFLFIGFIEVHILFSNCPRPVKLC